MIPLRHYAEAVRREWWIPPLVLVAALVTSAILTARQPHLYQASTSVVVIPAGSVVETADILRSLDTLDRRTVVATFAEIPKSPEARLEAGKLLGRTWDTVRGYRVTTSVQPNTNIIRITVEGRSPEMAADLANTLAEVTKDDAQSLYRIFRMRSLTAATASPRPVYPDVRRNYTVATILGLLGGVGAAYLIHQIRRTRSAA